MDIIEVLNWRYATKRMNRNKVAPEKIKTITEAIRLSASGYGLQPYTILIIEDPLVKEKIFHTACPQPQVVESSHLLVFCASNTVTAEDINNYASRIVETRNIPVEVISDFVAAMQDDMSSRAEEAKRVWAEKQTYLALGFGLVAAAVEGVDASPMEGFNPKVLDQLLHLDEKNIHSVALMALGCRDEANDFLVHLKKVRKSKEELFVTIDQETLSLSKKLSYA